jgi:hypothetical protein
MNPKKLKTLCKYLSIYRIQKPKSNILCSTEYVKIRVKVSLYKPGQVKVKVKVKVGIWGVFGTAVE